MKTLAAIAALSLSIGLTMAHAETVRLYSAGSLKGALTDVAKAYEAKTGNKVDAKFGPSGVLKDEIVGGAKVDVFTSANMEHPQALNQAGKSGPATLFTRNTLCALVKPGLSITTATLLDRMLDPTIKVGTSTPKSDPSGDYAFEAFKKAETVKPGAQAALEKKALQLVGAKDSAVPPTGQTAYAWHMAEGRADLFLTYCTNALAARKENAGLQVVALPAALSVAADYGLTVINGASPAAQDFAHYITSTEGQKILVSHGFTPVQP